MTAQNRVSCLTHFGIAIPKRSIQRQSRPGEKITIAQQINSSNLSLGSGEARFARYGAGKGQPRAALTANRPPSRRPRPRTRGAPPGGTVGGWRSEGRGRPPPRSPCPARSSRVGTGPGVFQWSLPHGARPGSAAARRGRVAHWALGDLPAPHRGAWVLWPSC